VSHAFFRALVVTGRLVSGLAQLIATAAAQQRRRRSEGGEGGVPRQLKLTVDQDNAFVQVRRVLARLSLLLLLSIVLQ
jgi:hypothetical protein